MIGKGKKTNSPNKLPPRVAHKVSSSRGEFFRAIRKIAGLYIDILNTEGR